MRVIARTGEQADIRNHKKISNVLESVKKEKKFLIINVISTYQQKIHCLSSKLNQTIKEDRQTERQIKLKHMFS